jgi:hypothetical protein
MLVKSCAAYPSAPENQICSLSSSDALICTIISSSSVITLSVSVFA